MSLPAGLWQQLGLGDAASAQVRISQGGASAVLVANCDAGLADKLAESEPTAAQALARCP